MDNTDDARRNSPHSRSRASAADIADRTAAQGEHAESRMRKRPRLDSGAANGSSSSVTNNNDDDDDSIMSEASASGDATPSPTTPQEHPPAQLPPNSSDETLDATPISSARLPLSRTPSKVTLNLRNCKAEDTTPAAGQPDDTEQTSDRHAPPSSSDAQREHNGIQAIDGSADSPLSSETNPVVEIEVEDPEDANGPDFDSMIDAVGLPSYGAELLDRFPYTEDKQSPAEAAKAMAIQLGSGEIEPREFWDIGEWLTDWLEFANGRKSSWHILYGDEQEFWSQVVVMYNKVLTRRTTFGPFPVLQHDGGRFKALLAFFEPVVSLCGHFIHMDVVNVRQVAGKSATTPELVSLRHIRCLELLFQPAAEQNFWGTLETKYRLNTEQLQTQLVIYAVRREPALLTDFVELAGHLASNIHVWSHSKTLQYAMSALSNVAACLRSWRHQGAGLGPSSLQTAYTKRALEVVQVIEEELQQNIDKQTTIPIETCIGLVRATGRVLFEICSTDEESADKILQKEPLTLDEIPADLRPRLVEHLYVHKLLWKYVSKGRMELRAQSMHALARDLIDVHHVCNNRENAQPVLNVVANLLLREKSVEYLVSVDSHPQLIMRSGDITGFLLVTKNWSPHLTDAIWNTITTSQDPRIANSTLEVMTTILHLAAQPALAGFCEKTGEMPVAAFTPNMVNFTERILEHFRFDDEYESYHHVPFDMCVRILKRAWGDDTRSDSGNVPHLRQAAAEMLSRLTHRSSSPASRRKIYGDCIQEIIEKTAYATGAIEIIYAMLVHHMQEDSPMLTEEMDIYRMLAEESSAFVQIHRGNTDEDDVLQRQLVRLRLLTLLMIRGPPMSLPVDLEHSLWDHLVGAPAYSSASREQGWCFFGEIINKSNRQQPFIDHCISDYLPKLAPQFFSQGLFNFVEASMQYMLRLSPPSSPAEDKVINIPLSDLLWKIILRAGDLHVEQNAESLLSRHHLDTPLIQRAPQSSIAATHAALVNHCIAQLKESASRLKAYTDGTSSGEDEPMVIVPTQDEALAEQMRFTRTLKFLRQFLHDVKQRPLYRDHASPSLPSAPASPVDLESGTPLTIKYQMFGSSVKQEMRELTIGSQSTFADLHAKLEKVTGASEFRNIILGGQKLQLKEEPDRKVESISNKGHLLVQCFGDPADAGTGGGGRTSSMGNSVAERTVLDHLDVLYDFLDLEDRLAAAVFEFLSVFPPHPRVRDAVLNEATSTADLFPPEKHFKTLYSLRSMREHLKQISKESTDDLFVLRGVKVLTAAFTEHGFGASSEDVRQDKVFALVDTLLDFFRIRSLQNDLGSYISNPKEVSDRLFTMLETAQDSTPSQLAFKSTQVYSAILEGSFHNREFWERFISQPNCGSVHYWLLAANANDQLRGSIRKAITTVCRAPRPNSAVDRTEMVEFYWKVLCQLLPETVKEPNKSKDLLNATWCVFEAHKEFHQDGQRLRLYFDQWTEILCNYEHTEIPGRDEIDEVVLGLGRLLNGCASCFNALQIAVNGRFLMDVVFNRYLFPPLAKEAEGDSTLTPVLDEETRKVLYTLVLSLCEDADQLEMLVEWSEQAVHTESQYPAPLWNTDRSRWLRSPLGYSGLKNLTNTCYMNSLLTQLFMNVHFRKFMFDAKVADANGSQKLLGETQALFANMQSRNDKYADTAPFTDAVKPYDGDHIDISVQMDVDEFYNLLFDRWEAQILTPEAKQRFRNFYGFQIVTQVKSKDCSHVSERLQPGFAVQCEVKGKRNLVESLKSYVEGDVMEGDNKYKCESCGGQFVNAVMRSCLKDIPDTLIFHLKRFDFDLTTLLRSKINDRFEFPAQIDMKPYTVEYLNDPDGEHSSDVYELIGILVHNGTAETGHYYSYIRLPPTGISRHGPWVEFNDAEVSEFDPAKIADQCFGGHWDSSGMEHQWIKPYNAYMLFYRRVSALEADLRENIAHSGIGPVINPLSPPIAERIEKENDILVRRYCLYGRAHASFVKALINMPRPSLKETCTDAHEIEHKTIVMVLEHLERVLCRLKEVPDFEDVLGSLRRMVVRCSSCICDMLHWTTQNPDAVQNLLLYCPSFKVRGTWAETIYFLLRELKIRFRPLYGLVTNEDDPDGFQWSEDGGAMVHITLLLKGFAPHLGKAARTWNEYFNLWTSLAALGIPEVALLLTQGIFEDSLELLLMDKQLRISHSDRHGMNYLDITRLKRLPIRTGLVRLINLLLKHVDPYSEATDDMDERLRRFDVQSKRFPPSSTERNLITYWDANIKQVPFLLKAIDGSDTASNAQWCPDEIVMSLFECDPPTRQLTQLASTITQNIDEYYPHAALSFLRTGLAFCRYCPSLGEGRTIIKSVSRNAAQLDSMTETRANSQGIFQEVQVQGGTFYLNFLKQAAFSQRKPFADESEELPFLKPVMLLAHEWAPSMLIYESRATREATLQLLHQLIFEHLPYPLEDLDGFPGELGVCRVKAVNKLFEECESNVKKIIENGLPRNLLPGLMTAMRLCSNWTERLPAKFDEGDMILELYEPDIVARHHALSMKAGDWTDLGTEEALSETEWASNFDEESDEETDV